MPRMPWWYAGERTRLQRSHVPKPAWSRRGVVLFLLSLPERAPWRHVLPIMPRAERPRRAASGKATAQRACEQESYRSRSDCGITRRACQGAASTCLSGCGCSVSHACQQRKAAGAHVRSVRRRGRASSRRDPLDRGPWQAMVRGRRRSTQGRHASRALRRWWS